jgi:hypothetical protein
MKRIAALGYSKTVTTTILVLSMSKTESENTRKLCEEVEAMGGMYLPIHAGKYGATGWPDRHITTKIWTGFIEFKNDDTKTKTPQRLINRRLNAIKPCSAYVVRHGTKTIEDAENQILGYYVTTLDLLNALAELTRQGIYKKS